MRVLPLMTPWPAAAAVGKREAIVAHHSAFVRRDAARTLNAKARDNFEPVFVAVVHDVLSSEEVSKRLSNYAAESDQPWTWVFLIESVEIALDLVARVHRLTKSSMRQTASTMQERACNAVLDSVMPKRTGKSPLVMTIGHSTHPLDEFIALLKAHGVEQLVDVRTIPRSRHNPQFNHDTLAVALRNNRIGTGI